MSQVWKVEPLDSGEVQKMMAACSPRCPTGLRNRALITILWRGGLRISEALALTDNDLNGETVRVHFGKGGKSRVIGLDPQGWAVVALWMNERARLGLRGAIFCTLQGEPVDASYVRHLLKRLARKVGVTKRVHPHGLRHSYAYDLSSEGIDVNTIRLALGHSNLSTTQRYIDHLRPEQLISVLASRKW